MQMPGRIAPAFAELFVDPPYKNKITPITFKKCSPHEKHTIGSMIALNKFIISPPRCLRKVFVFFLH